ncbi:hypothetical protein D9V34_11970 [Mycetocola lacteus]|uniref:SHOCT domain-containing protein n=1 Tax=Mycetocola lacteus TaxID=76637 RepID=A0A3L7ALP2_9MICO|nr:PH domain-containing protein [Mycetocola lacteus]RLP81403.1 hypothetical protein D9V34_11970 [Mycetocola lacteus]
MRQDAEVALKRFNVVTFGKKKHLERVEAEISPDERIIFITPSNTTFTDHTTRKRETLPGVFVLTSERIIVDSKVLLDQKTFTMPLTEIRSVSVRGNGLTGGYVQLQTQVNTIETLVTYKKDVIRDISEAFTEAIEEAKHVAQRVSAPQDSAPIDLAEQIEKLWNLLQAGVLTQEEFNLKKAELLGRL